MSLRSQDKPTEEARVLTLVLVATVLFPIVFVLVVLALPESVNIPSKLIIGFVAALVTVVASMLFSLYRSARISPEDQETEHEQSNHTQRNEPMREQGGAGTPELRADEATEGVAAEKASPTEATKAVVSATDVTERTREQEVTERAREQTRRRIAYVLIGTLVIVVLASFVYITRLSLVANELNLDALISVIQTIGTTILAPLVGLIGAVIGFYFGSQTAVQAASQATQAASQDVQTAVQAASETARMATETDREEASALIREAASALIREERTQLREALEEERSRGFFRRLFGLQPRLSENPEDTREKMRGLLGVTLVWTLIAVVVGTYAYFLIGIRSPSDLNSVVPTVAATLLTPLVGLIGAVIGFSFGSQTVVQGTRAANQSTQTATQASQAAAQAASELAAQKVTERSRQQTSEQSQRAD